MRRALTRRGAVVALTAAILLTISRPADAAPRVLSLDQCSDQFVLALAPRGSIVGLSPRVGDDDSYLRALSQGLPRRRASVETILGARPDLVVHGWLGDPRLARALVRRGVRVVNIEDAEDFEAIRANVRRVAGALGQAPRGEALIAHMDAQLLAARGAGRGRKAFYLTSGGATAGSATMIDAILRAAGLRNAVTGPGYRSVSLERLVAQPPDAFVLGFFDASGLARQPWSPGRHEALRRLMAGRTIAALSPAVSGCSAWFAGDAVAALAQAARRP